MPTYSYRCDDCGETFECQQSITAPSLTRCPECRGRVRRVITGGAGFIIKGSTSSLNKSADGCAWEQTGRTCCGRDERCDAPSCET